MFFIALLVCACLFVGMVSGSISTHVDKAEPFYGFLVDVMNGTLFLGSALTTTFVIFLLAGLFTSKKEK